ncbi:exopolysaccharide biosynthesis polyprenyl glycosylphosphotransferase [Sphingobium xenophagum]|uniref:Polysaccharide biosynthesis protein PslA n=1 Tax=Sphingobium xenophagum TaxID=121428 RepID=A0A401J8T5_SPHXE|nr:exopolysaccharide biosynthesis polyprenyl glycosylphosphotransferase [Sphingobium xenophagum]GBH33096.1 polysaccharide biosynthesis protein PslA [Sphingobium xenophagum]
MLRCTIKLLHVMNEVEWGCMTIHNAVAKAECKVSRMPLPTRGLSKAAIRSALRIQLVTLDLIVFSAIFLVLQRAAPSLSMHFDISTAAAIFPIYLILAFNNGAYSATALEHRIESIRCTVSAVIIAQISVAAILFFIKTTESASRLSFAASSACMILSLIVGRALFTWHVRRLSGGHLWNELLLLDGVLLNFIQKESQVIHVNQIDLEPDLHNPVMLHRFGILTQQFDRVMIASVPERHADWAIMLKGADVDGEIVIEQSNKLGAIGLGQFDSYDTLQISRKPLNLRARFQKRALDLAIAIPLLISLLPLLAVIALAIKLDTRGPILFRQKRVGRGNRLFEILKFRSMRIEELDVVGERSASRNDDRITRVGKFIRATSLDELPQLFNVLLGDMSLVGPRPHALGSLAGERKFWEVDRTYWQRHQLKPGITGLAQVRGFRGATHEISDLTARLQADMEYIQGWDIWRDLSILINTFRVIIHRNAY